jgi:hypothetical protein
MQKNWLFGTKGYSFFDAWSLVHFCFWVFIGSFLVNANLNFTKSMIGCLLVAYLWEIFEYFMAPRFPKIWKSPESYWNSWISDPLMCLLGVGLIWILLSK